jgi:hypothetical protein
MEKNVEVYITDVLHLNTLNLNILHEMSLVICEKKNIYWYNHLINVDRMSEIVAKML